jgi:hypothetical protein
MQQTILALAAVLIFSIYSLNRHGADASRSQTGVTAEIESAAAALAGERLHQVERRAFDESDVGREGARTSTMGLTSQMAFGPEVGEGNEASFDDLDDFHGRARTVTAVRGGQTLSFRDSVSVRYVDPANPAASPGTALAKEITVTVRSLSASSGGSAPVFARLRRVVTPASGAAHSSN